MQTYIEAAGKVFRDLDSDLGITRGVQIRGGAEYIRHEEEGEQSAGQKDGAKSGRCYPRHRRRRVEHTGLFRYELERILFWRGDCVVYPISNGESNHNTGRL